MSAIPSLSNEYLQMTGSVVRAGRRLQRYLETDRSKLEIAVGQLESAAQEHGSKSAGYQAFLFSQMEGAPQVVEEPVTEGLLATVLADIQTANVLIAAGQAIGETGQKPDPRSLEQALQHLETVQHSIEQAQSEGVPGVFGFAEVTAAPPSQEVATAEQLSKVADDTLLSLVSEAQGAVLAIVEAIEKLGIQKIGTGIAELASQVAGLQGIGRLLSQGVAKLRRAIDILIRLLGGSALQAVRAQAEKLWQDLKQGKLLTELLNRTFGVESAAKLAQAARDLKNVDPAVLARAGNDLAQLKIRFQGDMAVCRRLCSGMGVAAGILVLTPMATQSTAVIAGAYSIILAGVVLLGMDYADSGRILNRVRGVGRILIDLGVTVSGTTAAGSAN